MQQWQTRVVEEANLFNPAFCATMLEKAADDFRRKAIRPLSASARARMSTWPAAPFWKRRLRRR
jgi:hypothetical protein